MRYILPAVAVDVVPLVDAGGVLDEGGVVGGVAGGVVVVADCPGGGVAAGADAAS
jgi:hypothetical protein